MLPSALCQGVGVLKLGVFRGSITWPIVPPVYASYPALRPCPQDSEPARLARPSPYDSFIRYILPDSMPTALPTPPVVMVQARCLRHRVDATTLHPQTGTVERQKAASMFTQVNVRGISRLDQFLKMFVVARDDWILGSGSLCLLTHYRILRQIAFGVDQVNALKRNDFL